MGKATYGGSKTTERRRRNLKYAHRLARRSGRLFYWVIVGRTKAIDGTRSELPSVVAFTTSADRLRGIKHFARLGANHFTSFKDVNGTYALQIGVSRRAND